MSAPWKIHGGDQVLGYGVNGLIQSQIVKTVPSDGASGYEVGATIWKEGGTTLYTNYGTTAACQFRGPRYEVSFVYGEALALAQSFFVVQRASRLLAAYCRPFIVGSDGGAVTTAIWKAPSGTAIGSGTAMQSDTFNLKGTINTNQAATLSTTAADLLLAVGDAVGHKTAGTMTAARGILTLLFSEQ